MSKFPVVVLSIGVVMGSPVFMRAQSLIPAAPVALASGSIDTDAPQAKPVQPARPGTPAPPVPVPAPPAPAAAPAPAPPPPPPAPPGGPVAGRRNVQLEFTITDQVGTTAPDKKIVSMIAGDGTWGRVRAGTNRLKGGGRMVSVVLNVDARPFIAAGDTV